MPWPWPPGRASSSRDVGAVAPAWQAFADTLLVEAALAFRIDRAEPPRDFAGIVISG